MIPKSPRLCYARAQWQLTGKAGVPFLLSQLATLEREIHTAPNARREALNNTLISIGCRNPTLRDAAIAAATRIGKVEIDHGDTACKTPDAVTSIRKAWDYAQAKQADSPAAQERARPSMRTRC